MEEATYHTHRTNFVDVTDPVLDNGVWTFPNTVDPPYGGANFDIMAPQGGLVMGALALAKFGREYNLQDGSPRASARGGPGLTVYDPDNRGISHAGLLFGTFAETWELPTGDPLNTGNDNGRGWLTRQAGTDVLELPVAPCPVPEGLRISAIFNDEPPGTDPGLHDFSLVKHAIRPAARSPLRGGVTG